VIRHTLATQLLQDGYDWFLITSKNLSIMLAIGNLSKGNRKLWKKSKSYYSLSQKGEVRQILWKSRFLYSDFLFDVETY